MLPVPSGPIAYASTTSLLDGVALGDSDDSDGPIDEASRSTERAASPRSPAGASGSSAPTAMIWSLRSGPGADAVGPRVRLPDLEFVERRRESFERSFRASSGRPAGEDASAPKFGHDHELADVAIGIA